MSKIWTVYYFDGHSDHNLIVRADSKKEAELIIVEKYIPSLGRRPKAAVMSKDDMEEMDIGKKELSAMCRKGYYLYDHGT